MQGVLQKIFDRSFASYRSRHLLSVRERKAARAIRTCRTAEQGVHTRICPNGDYVEHFYNSCKHRSCPRCGGWETERWVREQESKLLPCPYYHVVFTLPDQLNVLWQYNRRAFVNHLFGAAWQTLRAFFLDPAWVGGLPGALMVFQSWGETLNTHPHLHVLVTAGGLDEQQRWQEARRDYLFPAAALTDVFKRNLLPRLGKALFQERAMLTPRGQSDHHWRKLLHDLEGKPWHAHIQPPQGRPLGLIRYLAFYLRGGPIAEDRIIQASSQHVRIAYKRPDEHRSSWMTLTTDEFLRRFLTHVPDKGVRTVRTYGLFHHRAKGKAAQARRALCESASAVGLEREATPRLSSCLDTSRPIGLRCPHCGRALIVRRLPHRAQAPPTELAA